jgi:hypothetical protein
MSETFLTLADGSQIGPAGEQAVSAAGSGILQFRAVKILHTAILGLDTSPVKILATPGDGRGIVPVSWDVSYNHGGTDYITNLDVRLTDSIGSSAYGLATNALSGTASKVTTGNILTAPVIPNDGIYVDEGGGDPGNGHADSYIWVRLLYRIANLVTG